MPTVPAFRAAAVLLLAASVSSPGLAAADWKMVADQPDAVAFVEDGSLRLLGERVRATVLIEHRAPRTAGEPAREYRVEKGMSLYNCKTGKYLDLQMSRYANRDTDQLVHFVERQDVPDAYSSAGPDTAQGRLLAFVCQQASAKN